ncbi:MAG TPA: amidohydrolase family protein [Bryobacteraceae bacterium]|jgi:cytosine/adenosine deaminase-related metal-dependent hydrolase
MARILIRNATVVTMDARLGTLPLGDVLIDGDRIAAIEPAGRIRAEEHGEVVDGIGKIVIPGLINAHLHTWQTALRGIAADWSLREYLRKMHAGLALLFRPEDLHIATLMGALNQLNCGTTTLVDWCHNNPTPEHNDAAIDALYESGIRAAFFHGSPKPDPKPGAPGFWEIPHPRAELERLRTRRAGGLVSIGAAILGPHYSTIDVARHDFRMTRELDVIASMHQGGGAARAPDGWDCLEREGLLGPCVNIVHGNSLTGDQLARFCSLGISFTVTPEVEMSMGHGFPITGRLRELGRAPSLGVDVETVVSGDTLSVARTALAMQRSLDHAEGLERMVPVQEALAWATIEGARMLCMEDRIGSLTVGKQADLVVIAADALNMQPVHDPIATVVMHAGVGNIDSVMVAGEWKKRDARLLASDPATKLDKLRESGERIVREIHRSASMA